MRDRIGWPEWSGFELFERVFLLGELQTMSIPGSSVQMAHLKRVTGYES
jgi:hypothetical protein